ncbi:MAG: aminotransferase class I/II-fold pyridoxal phosphate-dependent enzyme [Actinomycetota bacterium]|nr:aminotransferase class I/II-fold pyridoxal phosphate-dependent enzyme [Actinomycetota bacterium]
MTDGADLDRLRSLRGIKWARDGGDMLAAWVADMDFLPAPVAIEAVRGVAERGDFGYSRHAVSRIPEVWADWQERHHGWRPDVGRLRLFADVLHPIDLALWLHTEPGDGIVLLTPIYPPFIHAAEHGGRRLIDCRLDLDGWRLDAERLEACIDDRTRAILTCNPHNPTGRVFDRSELEAIAEVAERHDLLILSDEIWADLLHPGTKHLPMALVSPEAAARTVTISAASKSFNLAGLRTAIAHVGHQGVADAFDAMPSHALGGLSTPGLEATLACWTEGEPWLAEVRQHLTAQRDHLARRLARDLPAVGFQLPEATYLNWLDCNPLGLGSEPTALFREHGVALSPGSDFGSHGLGWVRLNVATSREILDQIIDRMVAAVASATRAATT